jgi:hypothetical protein
MVGQSKYYMLYVESKEDFLMFLAKVLGRAKFNFNRCYIWNTKKFSASNRL